MSSSLHSMLFLDTLMRHLHSFSSFNNSCSYTFCLLRCSSWLTFPRVYPRELFRTSRLISAVIIKCRWPLISHCSSCAGLRRTCSAVCVTSLSPELTTQNVCVCNCVTLSEGSHRASTVEDQVYCLTVHV